MNPSPSKQNFVAAPLGEVKPVGILRVPRYLLEYVGSKSEFARYWRGITYRVLNDL